jgi:FAD synthetase
MIKVLVFGTFDLLHEGHEGFLRQAGSLGDRLIASVSRDEFVRRWKGRPPMNPENVRLERLLKTGLVDEARLSDAVPGTYTIIREVNPDVICLGYDQKALKEDLAAWLKQQRIRIPIRSMRHLPGGQKMIAIPPMW